jgi:hypothetical protein
MCQVSCRWLLFAQHSKQKHGYARIYAVLSFYKQHQHQLRHAERAAADVTAWQHTMEFAGQR